MVINNVKCYIKFFNLLDTIDPTVNMPIFNPFAFITTPLAYRIFSFVCFHMLTYRCMCLYVVNVYVCECECV